MKQCVNFDWLEMYCVESIALTPEYLKSFGYNIEEREYGTPQYRQMYTILIGESKWLEVRRDPYSIKPEGGIMEPGACHIRLCNLWCYVPRAIKSVQAFLTQFSVDFRSITRVDICADFTAFNGIDTPVQEFISEYMSEKYYKENQPRVRAISTNVIPLKQIDTNISAYGTDLPRSRVWNSLSWGSNVSLVKTRLYNKTYEMKCKAPKEYIKSIWRQCGWNGVDDVWRVEFEVKASTNFITNVSGELFKVQLRELDDVVQRVCWFHALASRYFRFRKVVQTNRGTRQRKDRCPLIQPLKYMPDDVNVKPYTPDLRKDPTYSDKVVWRWLEKEKWKASYLWRDFMHIQNYIETHKAL